MNKKIGRERFYNDLFKGRKDVVNWEVLHINNEQELNLKFISTNSKFRQGIRIAIDAGEGYIEVNNNRLKEFQLWEDTALGVINMKCFASEGLLSIYNIWDMGRNGYESQAHTSGMIIEKNGNKLIYKCNDFGLDTNFDKLIFQIELI